MAGAYGRNGVATSVLTGEDAGVVRGAVARRGLVSGFALLAGVLARTLGPTSGVVWNAGWDGTPESLDDAATIARRIIELPDRCENAGAMLLRNLAWQMREQFGDGAAMAATLARDLVLSGERLVEAGFDVTLLRRGVERGITVAVRVLEHQAGPISGPEQLTSLARSVAGDPELAALLGEMFDLLGEHAAVIVEEHPREGFDREYNTGARWGMRPAIRLLFGGGATLRLERPLIAVADESLEAAGDVTPLLEAAASSERPLVLVCRGLTGEALRALATNIHRETVRACVLVPDAVGGAAADELDDLALMTGAEVLAADRGTPPARARAASLGSAASVTVTEERFTVAGAGGPQAAVRNRVSALRRRLADAAALEPEELDRLRMRAGRLAGATGVLKVGGFTERERKQRRSSAEKAVRVMELAVRDGVVAGGGAAYLGCVPALLAEAEGLGGEKAGIRMVGAALQAPQRQIARNAGWEPGPLVSEAVRRGDGCGFDAVSGGVRPLAAAGILDSLAVARGALRAAASCACILLTAEVTVLLSSARREVRTRP